MCRHLSLIFSLIRDCFKKYYDFITKYRKCHEQNDKDPKLFKGLVYFRRCLFTVSLLLRHFDFEKEEVYGGLPVMRQFDEIKKSVLIRFSSPYSILFLVWPRHRSGSV